MPNDIHELFRQVRNHPDFVFGTIFTRADFAGDSNREAYNPDTFDARHAEDVLAERGNQLIEDMGQQ